ncbi:hypothetical protein GCM10020331_060540 [Ectobacillus funiculus]
MKKQQAIVAAERDIEEAKGKSRSKPHLEGVFISRDCRDEEKLKKWDGKLPQVSGDAAPFIQIK